MPAVLRSKAPDLWFAQEGPPTGRLLHLSAGWEESLGYAVGELIGTPKLNLMHDADRDTCIAWATRLLASGGEGTCRARVRRKDGSYALYEWEGIAVPSRQLIFGVARLIDDDRDVVAHDSGLELERATRMARVHGAELPLTRSEFDLLLVFLEHRGNVLTADAIARSVWQYEQAGSRNFLQAHISRLRRKLRGAGISSLIETRRGVGYLIR